MSQQQNSIEKLGKYESILIRKLYFCPFEKKLLKVESGTFADIVKCLNVDCSHTFKYIFLKKMKELGVLIPVKLEGTWEHFIIDKQMLLNLLISDKIFRLDYLIIDNEAVVLDDNFPRIDPASI